jgi:hypothetical protein
MRAMRLSGDQGNSTTFGPSSWTRSSPRSDPRPGSPRGAGNTPTAVNPALSGTARHPPGNTGQPAPPEGVLSRHARHEHMALRWLPSWLLKIEKGPEREPGTPSDPDLLVGPTGLRLVHSLTCLGECRDLGRLVSGPRPAVAAGCAPAQGRRAGAPSGRVSSSPWRPGESGPRRSGGG